MSLLDKVTSIFGKKSPSVLGIDLGSSAIKVVQIKKKHGRAVLETYGELALGPYAGTEIGRSTNLSNDKIVEALKDILHEAKTTTNACGVALPLSSSLISFISLPPIGDKHISEVIALEARKYIPVPINEVMLDWSVIPREDSFTTDESDTPADKAKESQGQDVLVVAISNEYISNYQSIMAGSALAPSFYEIELFSSIRASIDQGFQAIMILDMGARATKLYIVERGILRASHIINKGSQDLTLALSKSMSIPVAQAETMKRTYGLAGGPEYKDQKEIITVNLDYMFYEANAVLLNYEKKSHKNISKVVLTGGGVLLKGFADLAKSSFQSDVVYANPFGKLETPAFLADQLSAAGPEFTVAIGAALRRLGEMS
ncbi:MAG: pilus assembly protein PilM [Candidatus Pacebacteria bacterium]|nr:pilus assembly protein PilM [Candidatus Paceibacterota bacterium]